MAATTKAPAKAPAKRKAVKAAAPARSAPKAAELKGFHHNDGKYPGFGFVRFWWEGDGPREGIAPKVLRKFHPVADPVDGEAVTAARTDLIIPPDAQEDYRDVRHLLERFDAKLPASEKHAYLQVTLSFAGATNVHGPFEEARAFAWEQMVVERRLGAVIVTHAPFLAGSENPLHVHLIMPLRRLGPLGWGEVETWLQNDRGRSEVYEAWMAFRKRWAAGFSNSATRVDEPVNRFATS